MGIEFKSPGDEGYRYVPGKKNQTIISGWGCITYPIIVVAITALSVFIAFYSKDKSKVELLQDNEVLEKYAWNLVTIPNDTLAFFREDMSLVTGIVIDKYPDNSIRNKATFKDGKWDGLNSNWYENGQLKSEVNWKYGKKDGLIRYWYENGHLYMELNNKDDVLHGLFRSWYENGQLKGEFNYKEGIEDGLQRDWYENGQLKSEAQLNDGEIISVTMFDEIGTEL